MENAEKFEKTVEKWVKKVLENRHVDNIKVEFPKCDTSGGYAGEIIFVEVKTEKNGKIVKLDLLIKKNKDGDAALETLEMRSAYENELSIYENLVPYFEKFAKEKNTEKFDNIPYCYGTIEEKDRYVIIMENLKTKGYELHNIKVPMDLNHTKLVLEAYAKWHAFSFALKDQNRTEIFQKFKEGSEKLAKSKMLIYFEPTLNKEFDDFIAMCEKKNNHKTIEKLKCLKKNYIESFKEILTPTDDDYLVVRHGDCWNNNFLFHYNGNEENPDKVIIIDWQMGVWGPPLADVTQFLFYGCSRKELEHLDELLIFYYDNLSKKIRELGSDPEKCFTWDVCVKMFKKYAPVGISGCFMIAKMGFKIETGETYDITKVLEDGNFTKILGELGDPEGFYERVNGVFDLCIERKLI